jgi:hypothetical protein
MAAAPMGMAPLAAAPAVGPRAAGPGVGPMAAGPGADPTGVDLMAADPTEVDPREAAPGRDRGVAMVRVRAAPAVLTAPPTRRRATAPQPQWRRPLHQPPRRPSPTRRPRPVRSRSSSAESKSSSRASGRSLRPRVRRRKAGGYPRRRGMPPRRVPPRRDPRRSGAQPRRFGLSVPARPRHRL